MADEQNQPEQKKVGAIHPVSKANSAIALPPGADNAQAAKVPVPGLPTIYIAPHPK